MSWLSSQEAADRLKQYGANELSVTNKNPWYKILAGQFTDILVLILIGAAVISLINGEISDAIVIIVIVLLNGGIWFFQEYRTEKTLEALKKMVHPEIRVIRDGWEIIIPVEHLVPGDYVVLAEWDKVPADGILKESNRLKVDESALTGESVPVEKKIDHEVFMGTAIARGSGIFEVVKTGMQTKFWSIAKLATETEKMKSPLQKELEHIGKFVAKVTLVICTLLFAVGMLRGESFLESLMFSVATAIAAVPEWLPTTITIALALGASVLARKMAIIKKLSSVETLGAVTTICSDKTGTLTKNEMTVREFLLADGTTYRVSGSGYDPRNSSITKWSGHTPEKNLISQDLIVKLLTILENCNDAELVEKNGRYSILGDPTEGSLITLAHKVSSEQRFKENILQSFPFDSDRKLMSVITKESILVKGSPDHVMEKVTHYQESDGTISVMTEAKKSEIFAVYGHMAENALRVLACAYRANNQDNYEIESDVERDLIFIGLVGMIDPPRDEVKDAVKKCHSAGIRTIIITGDYGPTAAAIGRELGMVQGDNLKLLTGAEVEAMILKDKTRALIFARSLPEQKMRIVSLLQSHGEIVAMTGDGVNDAPALKKADIGVAMGITGTEVSKEAATMILMNDSFASIVTAIEEGRRIYDNLKKFVWFVFSCNIAELFTVFAVIALNLPIALTAILILCIDLGTDILPAVALGVDNGDPKNMSRPPRNPQEKIMQKPFVLHFLTTGLFIGVCVVAAFILTLVNDGWTWWGTNTGWHHASTIAFATLVVVQLINTFSARSFTQSAFRIPLGGNILLVVAVITSLLMVGVIIYTPLSSVLHTTTLGWNDWMIVLGFSLLPLLFQEIIKWRKRNTISCE